MQKYPHITESLDCTQKMLAFMFLFCKAEDEGRSTNSLISSRICSTPKLSKKTIPFLLQNKAIQCVPTSTYSSRFISYVSSFIFLDKLFLEKTPLNLGSFG